MLGKLLKYEFKATGKTFLPLYGALLIVSIIQKIFFETGVFETNNTVLALLSASIPMIFSGLIVALMAVTVVTMVQRFSKNLLGQEGYLMFTLPVKTSVLIWSKLIAAWVWSILSMVVAILAFVITFFGFVEWEIVLRELRDVILYITQNFNVALIIFEFSILMIVGSASSILTIYLALSIGQLVYKHRMLVSVGAYVGISIIVNNILSAIFVAVGESSIGENIQRTLESLDGMAAVNFIMILLIVFVAIQAVVYFICTNKILTKRLNLE